MSDAGATFDKVVQVDASTLRPMVSWGTSPEMVVPIDGHVPHPAQERDPVKRAGMQRALEYMALEPGTPVVAIAPDKVFFGSCTNARIEDLRAAAAVVRGKRVSPTIKQALVVPGSGLVKAQAEAEGLDRVFTDAGFEWREPGCSMCLGMNDDRLDARTVGCDSVLRTSAALPGALAVHVVDQDKARLLGLSTGDIQGVVQAALDGAPVTQIRRGEELVDIVVRATPEERKSIGQLGDLPVFARSGVTVPLSQIARIEPSFEEPVLWRRNRDMVLTVRSDLVVGVQGPFATAHIRPSLKPIVDSLPVGYRIEEGGAIEESDKANAALFAVFPAMFAVTLTLLMIQLQSFSRLFMVFMTGPLAIIGVVPALLIFQAPFGLVALLGVVALGGMIMRNSIILVDQIDQDIARGVAPWTAIVDARVRRSRPVVLTAAAAVLAMIPLTRSVFWGPMAISVMGGLVVATALTLVFVPALYAACFRVRRDSPAHAEDVAGLAAHA